jgi:peptidoglycan/xylan/chitin deacetylase (PgdA/CDA1 family)
VLTSFFVIGEKLMAPAARAIAERAHADGHWIGNHSWSHSLPLGQRSEPDIAEREIGRTQQAIGGLAHPRRYFRPSGGGGQISRRLLNPAVVDYLVQGKFTCVLWNAIPRDWNDPEGWLPRALEQCRAHPNSPRNWTLMVLHDLPSGAMRHLDRFLAQVGEMGGRLRQDFPPDCMPVADGLIVHPIGEYVSDAGGSK